MTAPPLNSPLEAGLRVLALLSSAFSRAFDLASLSILDHILLHSEDFGGPPSLHPDVPNHQSEITVKRELIEHGLEVMIRANLVTFRADANGIFYSATDNGPGFVNILESEYMGALRVRAEWVVEVFGATEPAVLRTLTTQLGVFDSPSSAQSPIDGQGEL
jgi:hypothetical protein